MPHRWVPACFAAVFLLVSSPLAAQTAVGPVTVGAGLRSSYTHISPDAEDDTDKFALDSARIYVNGPVTEQIKFMFNTEYDGSSNKIGVLDAVARIELSPKFNVWMGRFLPPSDRANLYGPYYAHHWGVFTDGLQNGHPFVFQGRDNGVAYWGDFGKVKLSGGAFDGESADGNPDVLGAARVQIDFWDKETGYYLNGTYYGAKNLLGVGAAIQAQSGNTASTIDFLLEKKTGRRRSGVHHRVRVRQLRQARRLRRELSVERRRVHPRQLPLPQAGQRHGPVRNSRQVRQGHLQQVRHARGLRPGHHRDQLQLRDQGIQRAADVLLHQHELFGRQDRQHEIWSLGCRFRCEYFPFKRSDSHETTTTTCDCSTASSAHLRSRLRPRHLAPSKSASCTRCRARWPSARRRSRTRS